MKALRTAFLLLLTSLTCSCNPAGRLSTCTPDQLQEAAPCQVLNPEQGSLLFKSSISIGKRHFSGLFLIKQQEADSSIRVLFLSEVGLNLLDLEFRGGKCRVVSVKDFLNKTSIIRTLERDFQTLLLDLSTIQSCRIGPDQGEGIQVLKLRYQKQGYRYTFRSEQVCCHILRKKGLLRRVHYELDYSGPLKIGIRHPLGLEMTLIKLKREK